MKAIPVFQVDAFADAPFTGNPAAVCLLDEALDEAFMQAVAAEMNLSETAFLRRHDDDWDLRWFTPTVEVDLCGHATLASAHVLWETGRLPRVRPARFHTRSGALTAERCEAGIALDLPADPAEPTEPSPELAAALGALPLRTARGRLYELVELGSADEVRAIRPDFVRLAACCATGVIVTAPGGDEGLDFVSRFFAPSLGVDEDPVTGSAHCSLAPWWAERLGREALRAAQLSARGGSLRVRWSASGGRDRVRVEGAAFTVLRGELLCGP